MCLNLPAQNRKTTLEARVVFLEEVITEDKFKGRTPYKGFALSFINNSDQDIYIPYFFDFIRNKSDVGLFITIYTKDMATYKPVQAQPWPHGDNITGLVPMLNTFNRINNTVYNKLLDTIKLKGYDKVYKLLTGYKNHSLFIKAHQEKEYFLPLNIPVPTDLGSKPGKYKITFEPLLTKPLKDEFPDKLMGYNKFYPTAIQSNTLYLDFPAMVKRGLDEED